MQFQPAFEQMRAIVEADDCLLQSYKQDFYQYDLDHLTKTGTVGGRYVWVSRRPASYENLVTVG